MHNFLPLYKREFLAYFRSPVAYVFMAIFLLTSYGCAFFLGKLYESNQASLDPFFNYLPWLYLVLVPAVGMRLWAEERRSGSIELLFTLPITMSEAILAKFFAGWSFIGVALLLTLSLVATVAYLGSPDWGVIIAGYLGSYLMAGSYLAISCFTSATTKNQVIAFILGVVSCFVLVLLGWGVFSEMLATIFPVWLVDFIASLGFTTHFVTISRGLVDLRDLVYFLSVMAVFLLANQAVLMIKKAQ